MWCLAARTGVFFWSAARYPVYFSKEHAQEWLEAIRSGKPSEAPDGDWNIHNMLALAGVLHFAVSSHGPPKRWLDRSAYERLPLEYREATDETFGDELMYAVAVHSKLVMTVTDGKYDARFEPSLWGAVRHTQEGPEFLVVDGRLPGKPV